MVTFSLMLSTFTALPLQAAETAIMGERPEGTATEERPVYREPVVDRRISKLALKIAHRCSAERSSTYRRTLEEVIGFACTLQKGKVEEQSNTPEAYAVASKIAKMQLAFTKCAGRQLLRRRLDPDVRRMLRREGLRDLKNSLPFPEDSEKVCAGQRELVCSTTTTTTTTTTTSSSDPAALDARKRCMKAFDQDYLYRVVDRIRTSEYSPERGDPLRQQIRNAISGLRMELISMLKASGPQNGN